jgi:hypothetical protein
VVVEVAGSVLLRAEDVLAGKVDVAALPWRHVFLRARQFGPSLERPLERLVAAMDYMAKFGWRAVSYSEGICLLERVD